MIGLVLSPSGKLLAGGGADRLVKVWDVETGKLVQELSGLSYAAPVLIFSEDEKTLTTLGGIKTPVLRTEKIVWSIENGSQKQTDVINDFGPPFAATVDGTILVGTSIIRTKISSTQFSTKKGIRTYKVASGEFGSDVLNLRNDEDGLFTFAPNKAVLAIAARPVTNFFDGLNSSYIFFWNGQDKEQIPRVGSGATPSVMKFSSDSRILATWYDNLKVNIYRAP